MKRIFVGLFILLNMSLFAQSYSVIGKVVDAVNNDPLPGANVLLQTMDSTNLRGVVTGDDGGFLFNHVPRGKYQLLISYIGYKVTSQTIIINQNITLKPVSLSEDKTILNEVEVKQLQERVKLKGDTTQFNAAAYKTNPDASAQDLIVKMPGVTVQNGKVQAQGEDVKKVLVDGKEFFSSDPNLALKTLPAEIVDKVEVYDDKSEQSKFTGFDDGNTEKTVNIVTKEGKNNGKFGKAYGGYGSDNRYNGGFNLNYFKGARRITLMGNFNNINQQNFSIEDILGAMGNTSFRVGGQRMITGGGISGDIGDFLVGQENGMVTTNAVGLNYIDEWGKKFKINGNYFFNQSSNTSQTILDRKYFSDALVDQTYSEQDSSKTNNYNHRVNLRMEYDFNDNNSVIFRPSASFQTYKSYSFLNGATYDSENKLNSTTSESSSELNGYNLSGDLLYRHKFAKDRRTISLGVTSSYNNKEGNSDLTSSNIYVQKDSTYLLGQKSDISNSGKTYSGSLRYTEPIGEKSMLMVDYSPSVTFSDADKRTYQLDSASDEYINLQSNLSNVFSSQYQTQEAGAAYMMRSKTGHLMVRLNYQNALLQADEKYPLEYKLQRTFNNILPMVAFSRKFNDSTNVHMFYRASSNAPGISQLQDVVDNTNTLQLKAGNPDLKQEVSHFLVAHLSLNSPKKGKSLFLFLMGRYKQDYIGNSTFTASSDTSINGYTLPAGAQFTKPVNLDNYYYGHLSINYNFPLKFISSNMTLDGGPSFTNAPGLINGKVNYTRTTNLTGRVMISSNISEKVDFTLSYDGGYNIVKNTLARSGDNNYFSHSASAKFNWLFGKGFVFNTDLTNTYYNGLSSNINQNYVLWNAYFGYKFLKNNAAELKLSVFDILGQNTSVSRTINETYLEDVQTTVLQRYLMLTFTYTLRKFNGNGSEGPMSHMHFMGPPPH